MALVSGALTGKPAAFRAIMTRYNQRLYRLARGEIFGRALMDEGVDAIKGRTGSRMTAGPVVIVSGTFLPRRHRMPDGGSSWPMRKRLY
jgi:hypothetical protein